MSLEFYFGIGEKEAQAQAGVAPVKIDDGYRYYDSRRRHWYIYPSDNGTWSAYYYSRYVREDEDIPLRDEEIEFYKFPTVKNAVESIERYRIVSPQQKLNRQALALIEDMLKELNND